MLAQYNIEQSVTEAFSNPIIRVVRVDKRESKEKGAEIAEKLLPSIRNKNDFSVSVDAKDAIHVGWLTGYANDI